MGAIKNWLKRKRLRYYKPPQILIFNEHDIKLHYPIKQYIQTTVSKLPLDFSRYIHCSPYIYVSSSVAQNVIITKYIVITLTPKICKFYHNSTAVCYNILRQNLDRYHIDLVHKILSITTKDG